MAETAVRQARRGGTPENLHFAKADVHHMPQFATGETGLVTAFQTHFHWAQFETALREIRRILCPGGQLVLACERQKLGIYLPGCATRAQMQRLAKPLGFAAVEQYTQGPWVCFVLTAGPA